MLGQMNKEKLLLLVFMQNDREGRSGIGLDPIIAREEVATRTQVILPGMTQAGAQDYMPPRFRACRLLVQEAGWL